MHRLRYQGSYQDLSSLMLLHNICMWHFTRPEALGWKLVKDEASHWYITSYLFNIMNLHWRVQIKCAFCMSTCQQPLNTNYQCKHGLFFGYYENSENFQTRWIVWLLGITVIKQDGLLNYLAKLPEIKTNTAWGPWELRDVHFNTREPASLFILEKIAENLGSQKVLMYRITWKDV